MNVYNNGTATNIGKRGGQSADYLPNNNNMI